MTAQFNSLDKLIIDELILYESFELYERVILCSFNPIDTVESIKKLSDLGLLIYQDGTIRRTELFKQKCIKHRKDIYGRKKRWRKDVLTESATHD